MEMILSKDNYREIGRWLDLSSMKKMRLMSKGMEELYTMEWMKEKGKAERINCLRQLIYFILIQGMV